MITALYAAMHFLVDFVCAWAMFGFFRDGTSGYWNILIYNFCAFALQMPFGTLLDLARDRAGSKYRPWFAPIWAFSGLIFTVMGALANPWLLGLGNALFHVGGGMDVIQEDFREEKKGRCLGVFVAPGALGLHFGTILGKMNTRMEILVMASAVLALSGWFLIRRKSQIPPEAKSLMQMKTDRKTLVMTLCCFLVVILRSWVGLTVSFSWKSDPLMGLLAVVCVVGGKMLGGFASARWGTHRAAVWSLILAALSFPLGEIPGFGLAALLLFNMSMPITLYLLAQRLPGLRGFSFGLLTFGLFLGFLPVYAGVKLPISGPMVGMIGSIISLALLAAAGKVVDCGRVSV